MTSRNLLVMMELPSAKPNKEWSVNTVLIPIVPAWRIPSWHSALKAYRIKKILQFCGVRNPRRLQECHNLWLIRTCKKMWKFSYPWVHCSSFLGKWGGGSKTHAVVVVECSLMAPFSMLLTPWPWRIVMPSLIMTSLMRGMEVSMVGRVTWL